MNRVQGLHQNKPPFPYRAGAEFSGILSANSPIPKGCPFVPGKTRVFGSGQGAYAEKIEVDWRRCLEIPEKMGFEEAAGLSVTFPYVSSHCAKNGARLTGIGSGRRTLVS